MQLPCAWHAVRGRGGAKRAGRRLPYTYPGATLDQIAAPPVLVAGKKKILWPGPYWP